MTNIWWKFWESIRWDAPKVVLSILLFGFVYACWRVQQRPDFDLAEMFRDENNKVSAPRFMMVGTWVAGTWYVMQDMMDGVPTAEIFWAYLGIFGAVGTAAKAIDKWKGGA